MYPKIFLLTLVSMFLLNSCEYAPTETYYNDITISPPGIDLIILDENNLNALRGIVNINYSAVLNGKEFVLIQVLIDEGIVKSSTYNGGVLEIDTRLYTDGEHTLKLQMLTSTGTGSLADRLGAEVFILTKEYSIYIINAPITAPEIEEMFIQDNALHVRWQKYEGPGFQKYIYKHYSAPICEIYDQNTTECIDSAYAGGYTSRYLVTVIANHSFNSSTKLYNVPDVHFISATLVDDDKIHLTWERSNFDVSFDYYKIYLGHYDDPDAYVAISDINTTSFTDTNPLFGGSPVYGIVTIPKIVLETELNPQTISAPAIGQDFIYAPPDFLEYVPARNSYFVYHNKKISVFDLSFNETNSAQFSFDTYYEAFSADISTDGDLLYLVQDYVNTDVAKINSSTLQIEQTYNLNDIAGFDIGVIYGICISDNNLLLVYANEYLIDGGTYVFDMNTQSLIAFAPFTDQYVSHDIKISNNGKYIRTQDDLFKLENSTLTFLGNVSRESLFLEDSEHLATIVSYNTIQILKCSDLSVQKEYVFPYTLYIGAKLDVDKTDGYIGVEASSRGYYYILDMQNIELKKSIPIRNSFYNYQNKAIFGNNRALHVTF